ncbi:Uncharacterised protein [Mycobacteroides abscessus subsp. abscessus]|nr:Uncharacterised protein [Mycobacteroides abscessus subsp. abscessus]
MRRRPASNPLVIADTGADAELGSTCGATTVRRRRPNVADDRANSAVRRALSITVLQVMTVAPLAVWTSE